MICLELVELAAKPLHWDGGRSLSTRPLRSTERKKDGTWGRKRVINTGRNVKRRGACLALVFGEGFFFLLSRFRDGVRAWCSKAQ